MSRRFTPLFEPLAVRGLTLANRIVCPPMVSNRGLDGRAARAWYAELAAGGAGMVIVESTQAQRVGTSLAVGHLEPLARAIREAGAVAVLQLSLGPVDGAATPEAISAPSLSRVPGLFGDATRVVREAGFDGVEPHGAHGFLLNQFFSPQRNHRRDRYGDGPAGRMVLGLEIAAACRSELGDGGLLLYRHTPVERDGYGLEESLEFAGALVSAGVDVLDLSPSSQAAPGDLAQPFQARFGVPVIAVGNMGRPDRALEAVVEGRCDLVAVGRGLLADPLWPRKVAAGELESIVECTECNEGCFGNLRAGEPILCVQRR